MGGHEQIGGMAGSSYLRGMNVNQFNDSKDEENWDQLSRASTPENYS